MATDREAELERRRDQWDALLQAGGPFQVAPNHLHRLRIYGGQQGIYRDVKETRPISTSRSGVTVSLLHKGSRYPDDFDDEGVIYHYPETERVGADEQEIEATKEARRLELPVFVITESDSDPSLRDVRIGWVEDWDDQTRTVYVAFGEEPPEESPEPEEQPFSLTDGGGERGTSTRKDRPGQAEFKFKVKKRYGPRCAFCGIDAEEVLDAIHLYPKRLGGTDDPRNGLVLCALHHRALDEGLIGIEPDTCRLIPSEGGPSLLDLYVVHSDLDHLPEHPHPTALGWAWEYLYE